MPEYGWEYKGIEALIGCVFSTISGDKNAEELVFWMADGSSFKMYHPQDCCESVYIEDLCGELDWLVNTPILEAYESSSSNEIDMLGNEINAGAEQEKDSWKDDSQTWTFYRITTIKGTVTIRWYGSSNGYYSESVNVVYAPAEAEPEPAPVVEPKFAQAVAVAPKFTWGYTALDEPFPPTSTVRRIKD